VQHLRSRRDATPAVALRQALALDYVIDHLDAPWLPTDGEKAAAFTAAGVPEDVWPGRVYVGTDGARRRPFVNRLPLALDAGPATFVFVEPEEASHSALRTWGGQHAVGCGPPCWRQDALSMSSSWAATGSGWRQRDGCSTAGCPGRLRLTGASRP